MTTDTLTARQRRVLSYVRDYSAAHGYPPTLTEIGKHLGIKRSTVFGHVKNLIAKGRMKRTAKTFRTLTIIDREERTP